MRIYWKNLIWNYTIRYWWKLKFLFRSRPFKNFYCSKLVWNSKQKARLEKAMTEFLSALDGAKKSLSQQSNQQP